MANQKKRAKTKLTKKYYPLIAPLTTQKKEFKIGDKIKLTKEGYNYLKSINKVN